MKELINVALHKCIKCYKSTSPNYIFLASLDMARHQLATVGEDLIRRTVELSLYLRS